MARYLTFNDKENLGGGQTNRWTVTRYKASMQGTCTTTDVGQAGDYGIDPTADAILAAGVLADNDYCWFPTHRAWSAGVEGMLFWVEIEGNATADLTVDLEFYEGVYDDTGAIVRYRLIRAHDAVADNKVVGIETDGAQVFVRVAGITNPDGSASMYLSCKRASHSTSSLYNGGSGGGAGLILDEELAPVGNYVWDGSDWVRAAGSAAGATTVVQPTAALLNCTEASAASILADTTAILADTAAIQTAVELIDDAVGVHDAATATKGLIVQGRAEAGTPAAVDDGDDVDLWGRLTGALVVAQSEGSDHTTDSVTNWAQPPTGIDSDIKDCAAAGTAYALVAASTPCVGVFLSAASGNAGQCRFGDSAIGAIATGGAYVPHDDVCPPVYVPIDDAAKIYVVGSNNGDDVIFTIMTR